MKIYEGKITVHIPANLSDVRNEALLTIIETRMVRFREDMEANLRSLLSASPDEEMKSVATHAIFSVVLDD